MTIPKIRITDDGGPIEFRLAMIQPGDAFGVIKIGDVEIALAGADDTAAERARALSIAAYHLMCDLLGTSAPGGAPAELNLLAAGPDLLEALRACRALIGSGDAGARDRFRPEAIALADAAIAKAETAAIAGEPLERRPAGVRTAPGTLADEYAATVSTTAPRFAGDVYIGPERFDTITAAIRAAYLAGYWGHFPFRRRVEVQA